MTDEQKLIKALDYLDFEVAQLWYDLKTNPRTKDFHFMANLSEAAQAEMIRDFVRYHNTHPIGLSRREMILLDVWARVKGLDDLVEGIAEEVMAELRRGV